MRNIVILTVPYITTQRHLDLARESLDTMVSSKHKLTHVAVVNKWTTDAAEQLDDYYATIIENDENNLSKAWNIGIEFALRAGAQYILIPNLDVRFGTKTIDKLVEYAEKNPCLIWSATEVWDKEVPYPPEDVIDGEEQTADSSLNFSCFMVDARLPALIGKFNEELKPAYHGDNDIHRRIVLAGLAHMAKRVHASHFYHYGSSTIKESANPILAEDELGSGTSRDYYVRLHGGTPGEEKYIYPFNDPEKTWKL